MGKILGGAAPVAYCRSMAEYRRRPDGIPEIMRIRPSRWVTGALSRLAAALCVALVPAVALAIYISMGLPLILVAAGGVAVVATWRWLRRHTQPPEPAVAAPLRLTHVRHGAPAHLGANRP
jgi:hypothetical protein